MEKNYHIGVEKFNTNMSIFSFVVEWLTASLIVSILFLDVLRINQLIDFGFNYLLYPLMIILSIYLILVGIDEMKTYFFFRNGHVLRNDPISKPAYYPPKDQIISFFIKEIPSSKYLKYFGITQPIAPWIFFQIGEKRDSIIGFNTSSYDKLEVTSEAWENREVLERVMIDFRSMVMEERFRDRKGIF